MMRKSCFQYGLYRASKLYTRNGSHSAFMPFIKAKIIKANKRNVETTLMNWEVYPESIYHILKKYSAYKNMPPLMITENGAAFKDEVCRWRSV